MPTIGTLAARLLADASGIKSGMGLTRQELRLTRTAFLETRTDSQKLQAGLDQLANANAKGAFKDASDYAKAVAQLRAELDPAVIAQQKLDASVDQLTSSLKEQIATAGMTADQIELYRLKQQGATAEQRQAVAALQTKNAAVQAAVIAQQKLDASVDQLTSSLKEQIATAGMTADQIELYRLKQQGATAEQRQAVAALQTKRQAIQQDADATARASQILQATRSPIERYRLEVLELNQLLRAGKITQDTHARAVQQATQQYHAATTAADRMGNGLRRAHSSLVTLAGAFGVSLGIYGLVRAMRSAIGTAEEFEQAMASSTAIIVGLTDQQRQAFEATAKQVAFQTKFSATEAAQAYYFLASAGLNATQQIKAMPVVATFAQAGMFDLAQATDLLTDAQMALGMAYQDAAKNQQEMIRLGDVLVRANILANASVEQFSTALTNKAGAALKLVNKTAEEGVAILAAYASQGVKGEEAGTALGIVLRDLQTKAIANQQEWDRLGVTVYDATGTMRNFADILGDLESALDGASDKQKRLVFEQLGFSDKSVAFTQMLLGQSDAIREYERQLRDAGGTMQSVAERQLPPLTAQLNRLRAEWDAFAVAFSKPIVSGLAGTTEEVGLLGYALYGLLEAQQQVGIGFRAWSADLKMVSGLSEFAVTKIRHAVQDLQAALSFESGEKAAERLRKQGEELARVAKYLDEAVKAGEAVSSEFTAQSRGEKFLEDLRRMRRELDLSVEASEAVAGAGDASIDPRPLAEAAAAAESLDRAVSDATTALREQIATLGMTADEAQRYKLEMSGATAEQLRELEELQAKLRDAQAEQDLIARGRQLTESLMTEQERRAAELRELGQLLAAGTIDLETYGRAWQKMLEDDFQSPPPVEIVYNVTGVDAAVRGSQQAAAAIARFRAETATNVTGTISVAAAQREADNRAGREDVTAAIAASAAEDTALLNRIAVYLESIDEKTRTEPAIEVQEVRL